MVSAVAQRRGWLAHGLRPHLFRHIEKRFEVRLDVVLLGDEGAEAAGIKVTLADELQVLSYWIDDFQQPNGRAAIYSRSNPSDRVYLPNYWVLFPTAGRDHAGGFHKHDLRAHTRPARYPAHSSTMIAAMSPAHSMRDIARARRMPLAASLMLPPKTWGGRSQLAIQRRPANDPKTTAQTC